MKVSDPPPARRCTPCRASRLAAILVILGVAVGCAAPARIEIPAELPLVTNEQTFEFRWALQQEPGRARAVGRVRSSIDTDFRLTLAMYGIDASGRIVSRGLTHVRADFGSRDAPFSVEISPTTGQETRYELRVIEHFLRGLRQP
jgi:hypothetical protein